MKVSVASVNQKIRIVSVLRRSSRSNLPRASAGKRGESNFVLAFGRVYLKRFGHFNRQTSFFPAREVQVTGFGIADFVWLAWRPTPRSHEGSAVEFRAPRKVKAESLLAFEMKLNDWRKALGQAYRYRYFADAAYVVLPPQAVAIAKQHLNVFQKLGVGLWSFDKHTKIIRRIYSPRRGTPLSFKARERAVATLTRFVKVPRIPGKV